MFVANDLEEDLQTLVGARSDANGLERRARSLKVKVSNSFEQFMWESASSFLDYNLPHTWLSESGLWKKHAVYFYLSV